MPIPFWVALGILDWHNILIHCPPLFQNQDIFTANCKEDIWCREDCKFLQHFQASFSLRCLTIDKINSRKPDRTGFLSTFWLLFNNSQNFQQSADRVSCFSWRAEWWANEGADFSTFNQKRLSAGHSRHSARLGNPAADSLPIALGRNILSGAPASRDPCSERHCAPPRRINRSDSRLTVAIFFCPTPGGGFQKVGDLGPPRPADRQMWFVVPPQSLVAHINLYYKKDAARRNRQFQLLHLGPKSLTRMSWL